MYPLLALWRKEMLALLRDKHGLLALFVMPAIFILVMSMALQDSFAPSKKLELGYAIVDLDKSKSTQELIDRLHAQITLRDEGTLATEDEARTALRARKLSFVLVIPADHARAVKPASTSKNKAKEAPKLRLLTDPAVPGAVEVSLRNQILAALGTQRANEVLRELKRIPQAPRLDEITTDNWQEQLETLTVKAQDTLEEKPQRPSSVQQSVPAWLIFSMFFVVVPMSALFITERHNGTLQRLRTQRVSYGLLLLGKLLPFFLINQIQALLMIGVGRYLVPLCGGDALVLPSGASALFTLWCVAAATSIAAVAWALLIASVVRTSEQATVIGGIGNILMGAIGGIMVPKFIMPTGMQAITQFSPMAWALEGLHDVMLRGAALADVLPAVGGLLLFASVTLMLAILVSTLSVRYRT
jgi:ABC-2 type transport system permease protein